MTKEEEEAFAFYENTMYGDSEIYEEEDLDDFTFPEKEATDIEKETEGHFNWHCEKVGELFGATYFNVCPGWTGKGLAFPTGLPKMVKKERGKFIHLFADDVFDVWNLFDIKNSKKDITPYWRVLKRGGELNKEYPGGIYLQREKLEEEGFKIKDGRYYNRRCNNRFFVRDYKKYLIEL